jgi:ribonucleoside-diphosphate reductase beta chain
MENIHSETYFLLINTLIKDQKERTRLFNVIETIPFIKKKAEWTLKWINFEDNNDDSALSTPKRRALSFAKRLIAFAAIKEIFYSGVFCSFIWIKRLGLMPGVTNSQEGISSDERLYCEFTCFLYSMMRHRLDQETVHQIIKDAVDIEKEFVTDSLPVSLIGMNATLMSLYIEFVADRLLYCLGFEKIYNTSNPFLFMENMQAKTNYSMKGISEYQITRFMKNTNVKDDENIFTLNAVF